MSIFFNVLVIALGVFVIVYAVYGIITKINEIRKRTITPDII